MNIISVIPLSRSKIASELSYFTASEIPMGAIVSVPLRSKSIYGIVTRSENADKIKMDIKNAPFEIRKLSKVKATMFFPETFMEACRELADYYATTIGSIIDAMISDSLLENAHKILPPLPIQADLELNKTKVPKKVLDPYHETAKVIAVQGDDLDRMSSWRSLVRQEFARRKSIAIYAPTIEDSENIFNALEKGIEGYIFKLNGNLTNKKIVDTWTTIAETDHPIVVILTGSFPVLPRGDVGTLIIERENSRGWISPKMPYLDIRHALETIGRRSRQIVYLADSLLRTETLYRIEKEEIIADPTFKWRSISTAKDMLVSMTKKLKVESLKPFGSESLRLEELKVEEVETSNIVDSRFRVLSPELENLIKLNREESTHMFILALRRGLATMTVCDDCETIVTCNNCSAPIVLHTRGETGKNFFMCHKCGEIRNADESCSNCGGWRLTPLGIGIDRVAEEIRSRFPDIDLFKIDSDTTKTTKQIDEVLAGFKAKPGSILLGTELASIHLTDRIERIAIVSLDSLFSLPDFRIQEKIMYTLVRLRAQATQNILVQTRKPEEKVFEYGLKGNLSDFYRMTVDERETFSYPPHSNLIKITIEGKKDAIAVKMAEIQKILEPRELDVFPAFTATVRGRSLIHGLLKMESKAWPNAELVTKLRALPPEVSIKINPESLL